MKWIFISLSALVILFVLWVIFYLYIPLKKVYKELTEKKKKGELD